MARMRDSDADGACGSGNPNRFWWQSNLALPMCREALRKSAHTPFVGNNLTGVQRTQVVFTVALFLVAKKW